MELLPSQIKLAFVLWSGDLKTQKPIVSQECVYMFPMLIVVFINISIMISSCYHASLRDICTISINNMKCQVFFHFILNLY